jgi:hypothetical protein
MGIYFKNDGKTRNYQPDDTENCFFIQGSASIAEIKERLRQKWPGVSMDNIRITPEHIQTRCLGYDLYDYFDYDDFLCIERIK